MDLKQSENLPMVTVVVCTFNQEHWIRQTLDSILAQRTVYPFEVIIGEDWGTDNTRVICQDYASNYGNVKMAPSSHNLGIVANWANCIKYGSGKYIMNCAGDDYWHNPDKIQQQVDFMEAHPECVLCHTDLDILNVKTNRLTKNINKKTGKQPPQGRIQKDILRGRGAISAVSTCYRRDAFEKYVPIEKFIEQEFPREDWPTQLILSKHGDIRYLPISTSTYRVGQESISNSHNYDRIRLRYEKDKLMLEYLYSLFPEWGPFNDGPWFDTYVWHSLLMAAYENNDFRAAKEFAHNYPIKGLAAKATRYRLSFFLFRLYRFLKPV